MNRFRRLRRAPSTSPALLWTHLWRQCESATPHLCPFPYIRIQSITENHHQWHTISTEPIAMGKKRRSRRCIVSRTDVLVKTMSLTKNWTSFWGQTFWKWISCDIQFSNDCRLSIPTERVCEQLQQNPSRIKIQGTHEKDCSKNLQDKKKRGRERGKNVHSWSPWQNFVFVACDLESVPVLLVPHHRYVRQPFLPYGLPNLRRHVFSSLPLCACLSGQRLLRQCFAARWNSSVALNCSAVSCGIGKFLTSGTFQQDWHYSRVDEEPVHSLFPTKQVQRLMRVWFGWDNASEEEVMGLGLLVHYTTYCTSLLDLFFHWKIYTQRPHDEQ